MSRSARLPPFGVLHDITDQLKRQPVDHWRREAERADPKLLYLTREDLMRHEAQELRTPVPVSVKRLQKMWESLGR